MRAGALAAVSIVAACLGAAAVLLIGSAAGWVGDESGVTTVVVPTRSGRVWRCSGADRGALARQRLRPGADLREPLRGRGHDLLLLPERPARAGIRLRRLRGRPHPDELARGHDVGAPARARCKGAERIYVSFHDGDRIPGRIVGWDLFNDTGLVKVDPEDHARGAGAARRLEHASSSASPSRRSGARSGRRARSRSASSPRPSARSSRSRPRTTSPTRSRSTRRSTTATPAGPCSTRAAA